MTLLQFLGWELPPTGTANGRDYYGPPAGSNLWGIRDLYIEDSSLRASRTLEFVLSGLRVAIEMQRPLALLREGNNWRPTPGLPTPHFKVRLGGGAAGSNLIAVGPLLFESSGLAIDFGPGGIPRVNLNNQRLIEENAAHCSPLFLTGHADGAVLIDFGRSRIRAEASAFQAGLRSGSQPLQAGFSTWLASQAFEVTFAAIARTNPENLWIRFAPRPAQPPIRLNVRSDNPTGGTPGVEAWDANLALLLGRGQAQARVYVHDAQLERQETAGIALRFHGIWNSRNEPEEWRASGPLRLAFRIGRNGSWSSPLVQAEEELGLSRIKEEIAGTVLPMHGQVPGAQLIPARGSRASLMATEGSSERDADLAGIEWRASDLRLARTRPWLRFTDATLRHPRPGDAYLQDPWIFERERTSGGLPVLPTSIWREGDPRKAARASDEVDVAFRGMRVRTLAGAHETGLSDATSERPRIHRVMPAQAGDERPSLVLVRHDKQLELPAPRVEAAARLAPIRLPIKADVQAAGFEFAVCWPGASVPDRIATFAASAVADRLAVRIDATVPIKVNHLLSDDLRPTVLPLAMLKLGRDRGMEDILREFEALNVAGYGPARDRALGAIRQVHPELLDRAWVGLVGFDLPLDFSEFAALSDTIPLEGADVPRLRFLALSPRQTAGSDEVAMSAGVNWVSARSSDGGLPDFDSDNPEREVSFWPTALEISFRDNKLTAFRSEAVVQFRSFFGVGNSFGANLSNRSIRILGSARRRDPKLANSPMEFRFAAEMSQPWQLYPIKSQPADKERQSFLKGVWFKRLELVDAPPREGDDRRRSEIRIDGSIEFQKPASFDGWIGQFFSKIDGRLISFRDLGIRLTGAPTLDFRFLEISYPSLSFDLDFPHVSLFNEALRLKLSQLAVNWNGSIGLPGLGDLSFKGPSLPSLSSGFDFARPHLFFLGRLDFGNLPSLFARSLSSFSLELGLGLNFDKIGALLTGGRAVMIRGFGFDGLNLDLLSFLEIRIGRLAVGALPIAHARNGAQLNLQDVSVKVLRHVIFEQAYGGYFSLQNGEGDGFWAYFPAKQNKPFLGFFEWGFAAQSVDFTSAEVARDLLVPPTSTEATAEAQRIGDLGKQLQSHWDNGKIAPARSDDPHGWTFAAGLSLFQGALRGRVLIQDSGYAGLSIWGEELKRWFGYDFSFCGIYRKNVTPGQDYFYISVTLPGVTMGGVRFTGGVIAAEVYTSGNFLLDFGFPWKRPSGGRLWNRTIGAIVTPGQASAGFYIRKVETDTNQGRELTLAAGFAVQWGLGAAFGGGVFRAWVRIGLYAAIEGQAVLLMPERGASIRLTALTVAGAGGLLVEGEGAIDWWVISVRVYVCASAEVRLRLEWREGQNTRVDLNAELYVSASAEACVGGGCFKICRSIHVGLTIPVHHRLEF